MLTEALQEMTTQLEDLKNEVSDTTTPARCLTILTQAIDGVVPSDTIQNFAHDVLGKCVQPSTGEFALKWSRADGQQYCTTRYTKVKGTTRLQDNASEHQKNCWVANKAREFIALAKSVSNDYFG